MDGILVIDKQEGYTSRDIVNIVGSLLNTKKVGHAGTLDPIATGVLVVAVESALKVIEFINYNDKEYIAKVKFGIETNTLDITGTVTKKQDNYFVDSNKLNNVVNSFKGKYLQEVPLYSSVKVAGKRLYKYARDNEEVELPKREVEIYNIEVLEINHEGFTFKAEVSKGTYIRSLIRDIGEKLGIPCTMESLRRTKQGVFTLDDAIKLSSIENNDYKFLPIEKVLSNYPIVEVDEEKEKKIMNGIVLSNTYEKDIVVFKSKKTKDIIAIYEIYDKDTSKIKPIKVLKNK